MCLVLQLPISHQCCGIFLVTKSAALKICQIDLPEGLALILIVGVVVYGEEVGVVVIIHSVVAALDEVIAVELREMHSAEGVAVGESPRIVGKGEIVLEDYLVDATVGEVLHTLFGFQTA